MAEKVVRTLLEGFPVVTITGPRQSGKTTLAKAVFADKPYVSLEEPDIRRLAVEDPRGFLGRLTDGAVIDEVQRAPEILSYLQTMVDAPGRVGRFLLTGSQQFGLMSGISQSLAGRSAFVQLLPFSHEELLAVGGAPADLETMMFTGGYPPLYDRRLSPRAWFGAYVAAYVERDVRQMLKVQDLETFQRFVGLCAGRSGQILNLSALADDCGVTHNTAKAWLSVLEASYLVFLLRPYQVNFNKRLIKSPKLFFFDTGLLCWLLGVQAAEQLAVHPLRGAVFETFVVGELMKNAWHRGERACFYFWRDSNGNEIDLIADLGGRLMPIEIKSGRTINRDYFKSLERWTDLAGAQVASPFLVYGGDEELEHKGIRVLSWNRIAKILHG
jgi:predicted AAA+ superfamily ATPase